jgi:hypothetical protein
MIFREASSQMQVFPKKKFIEIHSCLWVKNLRKPKYSVLSPAVHNGVPGARRGLGEDVFQNNLK